MTVRRIAGWVAVAVLGLGTGAAGAFAWQQPPELVAIPGADDATDPATAADPTAAGTAMQTEESATLVAPEVASATVLPATGELLLAWAPGGLPHPLAATAAALTDVAGVAVVNGDPLELVASWDADGRPVDRTTPGFVIPLDALAVAPRFFAEVVGKTDHQLFADLGDDQVLLGATSARLRGLDAGGRLELADGTVVEIAGVVSDAAIGGAEVVFSHQGGAAAGVTTPRYLLVATNGAPAAFDAIERALRNALPAGTPLRVRGPGETPWLRHGDAVLPQALVKEQFGEFSYRQGAGRTVEQEPAWTTANLETATVPLLGTVTCHRALLGPLRGALAELERDGLGHLVDADGFAGCHAARLIAADAPLSRHAWGIAVDLNWPANPVGAASAQDERLVDTMARWGFTWGGPWLVPDPAHFEWTG